MNFVEGNDWKKRFFVLPEAMSQYDLHTSSIQRIMKPEKGEIIPAMVKTGI